MNWTAVSLYAVFALGAVGIYFMLPRGGQSRSGIGAALAGLGLVCLLLVCGLQLVGGATNALFYLFSIIALAATARVVTHPKPVYSAIYFVLVVVTVAAMMILLEAEFLAIAVVMIYAGAILVTYVFVIMLAQQGRAPATDLRSREPFLAVCAGFLLMAAVAGRAAEFGDQAARVAAAAPATVTLAAQPQNIQPDGAPAALPVEQRGNTFQIGAAVMTRYVVALEISALLLLIAMVGAVILARKRVPIEGPVEPHRAPGEIGREVPPY